MIGTACIVGSSPHGDESFSLAAFCGGSTRGPISGAVAKSWRIWCSQAAGAQSHVLLWSIQQAQMSLIAIHRTNSASLTHLHALCVRLHLPHRSVGHHQTQVNCIGIGVSVISPTTVFVFRRMRYSWNSWTPEPDGFQRLSVAYRDWATFPPQFQAAARQLRSLDASQNQLTSLSPLKNCAALETLIVDNNVLQSSCRIPCLPSLRCGLLLAGLYQAKLVAGVWAEDIRGTRVTRAWSCS